MPDPISDDEWLVDLRDALKDSGARAHRLASLPQLSFQTAVAVLAELVGRQHADAARKLADPDYWGPVGSLVEIAAAACERAVRYTLDSSGRVIDFDALLGAIVFARHTFDRTYDDDDGYGAATFAEFLDDVAEFCASQEGIPAEVALAYSAGIDVADYSETFGRYLILPPAWYAFANALLEGDHRRGLALATDIHAATRSPDLARVSARLMTLAAMRAGERVPKPSPLGLAGEFEADFEDSCDALASGQLTIERLDTARLPPFQRCVALFWAGASARIRGEPNWRSTLAACADYDFDTLECVLASAELGIPWRARRLKAELAGVLAGDAKDRKWQSS